MGLLVGWYDPHKPLFPRVIPSDTFVWPPVLDPFATFKPSASFILNLPSLTQDLVYAEPVKPVVITVILYFESFCKYRLKMFRKTLIKGFRFEPLTWHEEKALINGCTVYAYIDLYLDISLKKLFIIKFVLCTPL